MDLVELQPVGTHGRYASFKLLSEDGFGVPYRTPEPLEKRRRRSPGMIGVQADFFREGWALVLTDAEIATYLAIVHKGIEVRKKPSTQPFFIPRSERLRRYALSDDSYGAHRELTEFGLIRMIDDEPLRRRGRLKPQLLEKGRGPRPFSFTINNVPKSALHVVTAKLARGLPAPHLRSLERRPPAPKQ